VGKDGTIYCGSSDGNLYAINPNGSTNWAYYAQVSGGSPAIALDNTVYIGGYDYLYATTPSGTLKWKSEVATSSDSPIVDSDGTIYVGSGNWGELYAFHPDGSQKWVRDVPAGAADSTHPRLMVVFFTLLRTPYSPSIEKAPTFGGSAASMALQSSVTMAQST